MKISAVILAGGKGERLFPLTATRPKPLCPVNNIPPLAYAIQKAKDAGADEITVTAGHMCEQIAEFANKFEEVKVVCEDKPLSTAGCVKNACPTGDVIMVLCGDTVCDFSLKNAVKRHMESSNPFTVITTSSPSPIDYGVVIASKGQVVRFWEKPSWHSVLTNRVNTGMYIFDRRILELIPTGVKFDFASDLFPRLMESGEKIGVFHTDGYWCDMGTPQSYYASNMALSGGKSVIHPTAKISKTASVFSSVICENTVIEDNCVIKNSIICENVVLKKGCTVETGCVIGGNTVIGENSVIAKGITLANGLNTAKGSYIMKNIYSSRFKTRLFDCDLGVGGVYGSGFDIADAVYLGQSLCSVKEGRCRVGVMAENSGFSRILAGVTLGGVRFGGGEAFDLGCGFLAECSFCASRFNLDFGVFVQVNDDFSVTVSVFDKSGMLISSETQQKIERIFRNRITPKKPESEGGDTQTIDGAGEYKSFLQSQAGNLSGVRVSVRNENKVSDAFKEVVASLGGSIGGEPEFEFSSCGTHVTAYGKNGEIASFWHLWCFVMGEKVKSGFRQIPMPEFSPKTASDYLRSLGGEVIYYSESESPARTAAGQVEIYNSACFIALEAIKLMRKKSMDLGGMLASLPKFCVCESTVPVEEDEKAERAKSVREKCDDSSHCSTFVFTTGRVSVMPSKGEYFKIFAEAVSTEAAEEISAKVKNIIKSDS